MPREAGRIIIIDPGADRPLQEYGTAQCVHCGGHFPIQPGSGKIRGFCMNCNGPICGPKCGACVPAEQQLENIEAGRPLDFRPIRIASPRFQQWLKERKQIAERSARVGSMNHQALPNTP